MVGCAAISVRHGFPPGEAGVPGGAADDEPARGVDIKQRLLVQQRRGQHRQDHLPPQHLPQGIRANVGRMLGGKDHCGDPGGPSVLIGHADLSFAVRQQPGHPAGAPHMIQPLHQRPCQGDRQGHQLRGLPAGVAGHDPLIPGAGILRRTVADALSDIR